MNDASSQTHHQKRVALITGASRGIGAAVAVALAKTGVHVVLTARTIGGLEEVDDIIRSSGGSASLLPMDIRQYDQIDALGAELFARYGRLDILVGNAAMLGALSPVAHMDPAQFEDIMAINVTANYRLLRSMDPLLRKSPAGRVVMVTSGAARNAYAYWGAYAASKAALETLTLSYAAEVQKTHIRVNLVDPGAVATAMRASAFPGEDAKLLPRPEDVVPLFLSLCSDEAQVPHAKRHVA
jgi:NAD(P)-dependent dehydrogenase (short-subunit alcohol dehydrogenase family)